MRRIEQALDLFFVRGIALVRQERIHFGNRRRQADQIEAQAAEQSDFVGFGRRLEIFLFQPGQDEGIDWVADPSAVFHPRKFWTGGCAKRPMLAPVFRVGGSSFRPISALIDPGAEQPNLLIRQ